MNTKKILWIAVGATLVVVAYLGYNKVFGWDKNKAINTIMSIKGERASNYEEYNKLGAEYLIAWAKSLKANQSTFVFNGKTYNTQNGKAA